MPVYSYRCGSCGFQFDRRQSFQEAVLKTCPECREKALVKVLAPVGIVFKGSGFYATDNRSGAVRSSGEKKDTSTKPSAETGKSTSEAQTTTTAKTDTTE